MASVIKLIGGSLLACAIVWAMVLGWWQSNDYEPTRLDLGLYLGALPLALVGGYLLLRGFIDHLKRPVTASVQEQSQLRDEDPLASVSAKTAEAERGYQISIIDSFMVSAAGNSADEILEAIDAGMRPEPSERLNDDSGFPVFVAEVQGGGIESKQEEFSEDRALRNVFGDELPLRFLALLDSVLVRAKERIDNFVSMTPPLSRLNVVCLIPIQMAKVNLQELRSWLQANYWPQLSASQLSVSIKPVSNENDVLQQVDEVVLNLNRDMSSRDMTLVVGAVSSVDEETIARLESNGQLFSTKNQDRRIPGEGAVALLLSSHETCRIFQINNAVPCSRASFSVRDKSVDAPGRVSGKLLEQLAAGLLDVAGVESDRIKAVVADTDHRANRVAELLDGIGGRFGHLDPIKDCLATGVATGDISPFGPMLAAACACGKAVSDDAPVMCISNHHETQRAVFLVGRSPNVLDPSIQVAP